MCVLTVQETGWDLTAAQRSLATPMSNPLCVFPCCLKNRWLFRTQCALYWHFRSRLQTLQTLLFKNICQMTCWTFTNGALSISKLTTLKCVFPSYCYSILLTHLGKSMLCSVFSGGVLSVAEYLTCLSLLQISHRDCAPCCCLSLIRNEFDLFTTIPRWRSK